MYWLTMISIWAGDAMLQGDDCAEMLAGYPFLDGFYSMGALTVRHWMTPGFFSASFSSFPFYYLVMLCLSLVMIPFSSLVIFQSGCTSVDMEEMVLLLSVG